MPVILVFVQTSSWFFNFQIQWAQCLNPQQSRHPFNLKDAKRIWQATSFRGRIDESIKPVGVVPSAPCTAAALITADFSAGSISCPSPGPWSSRVGSGAALDRTNGTSLLLLTRVGSCMWSPLKSEMKAHSSYLFHQCSGYCEEKCFILCILQ